MLGVKKDSGEGQGRRDATPAGLMHRGALFGREEGLELERVAVVEGAPALWPGPSPGQRAPAGPRGSPSPVGITAWEDPTKIAEPLSTP